MRRFRNILYTDPDTGNGANALTQALSLARNNEANLKVFIPYAELPKAIREQQSTYEKYLIGQVTEALQKARHQLNISETDVPTEIVAESGRTPAIRIVREVLRGAHDLLIKESEAKEGKGFKAIDMELLRKCPCPLWLCREMDQNAQDMRIAVAIDPEGEEPAAKDLSLNLLTLASALAASYGAELDIISCWDYQYENYLRHNIWATVADDKIAEAVTESQNFHRQRLEELITESGIQDKLRIHHLRGRPEQVIPDSIEKLGTDILVMGTVARTGIPGFVIGNTAENLVQRIGCSLLAMKPKGFVSSVKAY